MFNEELISFSTSSAVTGLHSSMAWLAVSGMSSSGVVSERMVSTDLLDSGAVACDFVSLNDCRRNLFGSSNL